MKLFGKDLDKELLVVAEIGVNHEGSLDKAKELCELAHSAGADAVKIQLGTVKGGPERKGGSFALSESEVIQLIEYCNGTGVSLFASAFDFEAVDFCAEFFPVIKVASRSFEDKPLLMDICKTDLPVIASVGASAVGAVAEVVALFNEVVLLHCVPEYPAQEANLEKMAFLKNIFNTNVGYSDHTLGLDACYRAVIMGAPVIEVHFTDDKTREFRDHHLSVEPRELADFVKMTTAYKEKLCRE